MSEEPVFDELDLLRAFRADMATPPPGLQARVEERLWAEILDHERAAGEPARWWRRHRRLESVLRQGVLAAATAAIVVAFAFGNHSPAPDTASTTTRSAGTDLLDTAISHIDPAHSASTSPYVVGDITEPPQNGPLVAPRTAVVFDDGHVIELERIAAGPGALSDEQRAHLPTDEHALLAVLRAAGDSGRTHDADFEPFRLAALYVSDRRVPPPTRVAFIRLLRLLDGVRVGGSAVDVFGRPGVMVSRLDETSLVLQQYLLDPADGSMLEHREYLAADRGDAACPAGTVIAMEAFDPNGFLVDPHTTPGRWPEVVDACSPAAAP